MLPSFNSLLQTGDQYIAFDATQLQQPSPNKQIHATYSVALGDFSKQANLLLFSAVFCDYTNQSQYPLTHLRLQMNSQGNICA
jgi:hypothetical protein